MDQNITVILVTMDIYRFFLTSSWMPFIYKTYEFPFFLNYFLDALYFLWHTRLIITHINWINLLLFHEHAIYSLFLSLPLAHRRINITSFLICFIQPLFEPASNT